MNPGPAYGEWANKTHAAAFLDHLHNITTHTCEIDGDVAHCESYVIGTMRGRDDKTIVLMGGRYLDRLERRDGVWRIAVRRCTVEWALTARRVAHALRCVRGLHQGHLGQERPVVHASAAARQRAGRALVIGERRWMPPGFSSSARRAPSGAGPWPSCRRAARRFAAATRDPARARELLGPAVECVAVDPEDPRSLAASFDGVDALLLIPPETGDRKRELARRIAEAAALRACGASPPCRASRRCATRASISRQVERDVEALGIAWTHLRPNFFMQNYHTSYRESIRRGAIAFYTGAGRTSLVDAHDVGAAAAAVLLEPGHEGCAPLLTGAEALDHAEIAAILSRVTGREIRYTARSHDDTRAALRAAGLSEAAVVASMARFREVEDGRLRRHLARAGQRSWDARRARFESYAREHAHHW